MGVSQLLVVIGVLFAFFVVTPEPARDSPSKLGDPASQPKPHTIKSAPRIQPS